MDKIRNIDSLVTQTSVLCCNFINTVSAWRGINHNEYFKSYSDVTAWCRKLNVYDGSYLVLLEKEATLHPEKAAGTLLKIKEIRQLLYELISAVAAHDEDRYRILLDQVNPLLSAALAHTHMIYREDIFKIDFQKIPVDLESPVWPVLKSLYDLLTQSDLRRIKECPGCGWVFLDETKNGKRRWCSPTGCGTHDKMLRYNQKKKEALKKD